MHMGSTTKHKILVVEDEADIQQVLCFFFKQAGFDVLGISGGEEAIHRIPDYDPDLIVLDLMMYPVSGWDVLHWLRDNRYTPPLPVLILTAKVNLAEQIHGFEEGAVEYLTKPTQPHIIVERVRALLALSTEQRIMLQAIRMDENRKKLERVRAPQPDEFIFE
jgi:DNA-binding response OmpR family regulator